MTPTTPTQVIQMTDDLLKLAERCEKASGPDRELDEAIALALGYSLVYPDPTERLQGVKRWVAPNGNRNGWVHGTEQFPPHYTASLDAAMTLCPTGESAGFRIASHPELARKNFAEVWTHEDAEPGDGFFRAAGKTPALALCAAALRSRATQQSARIKP